jgi:outer membrane receptor protein involved in Fe transport
VTTRDETRVEHALAFPGVAPIDTDQRYAAAIDRLALYAQDEWSPGAGWSLYLGVRWEGLQTSSEGNEFAPIRNRSSIFFPVLQSVWKIPGRKNDQLRLALTRTYNPPDVVKLIPRRYTSLNNTGVYPDREGNPKLRPEVAMGLDAAFEHYWAEKSMVSVSAYAREIDDFIREDVALVGGRWLATNINAGQAHTRGLEFDTRFPLTSLVPSWPGVELSANLTRNWSSVDDVAGPNNRLAQQTRLSAALGADYRLPGGDGSVGASFRFKTGGPVRVAYNETEHSSARRELDLYAVRKLGPKMQLRVTLLNLLRQPSWTNYGFTGADGSLNLVETRPSYATLRSNLEWQF